MAFTELIGSGKAEDNRQALGKLDERFRLQHGDRSKGKKDIKLFVYFRGFINSLLKIARRIAKKSLEKYTWERFNMNSLILTHTLQLNSG